MEAARFEGATAKRPRGRLLRSGLGLLLVLALGFFGGRYEARKEPAPSPGREEILVDTPTVLLAVQQLARLETVAYHMERVIDLKSREARMFGLMNLDDSILLVAVGDVVAGVDLAKLQAGDVSIERASATRASVRVRVPPAELLSVSLDNAMTRVHSRKTDLLAPRNDALETRARQIAEGSIRKAALDSAILERAAQGAERALEPILRSLGFAHVEFVHAER